MKIIKIDGANLELAEGVLFIEEFINLYENNKDKWIPLFKFIYLYADYNSPYKEYSEEDRLKQLELDLKITYNEDLKKAVEKYKELTYTFTMKYCDSALKAASKNMGYWDSVDYTEKDLKGNPIYSITEVQRSLADCMKVVTAIESLKEKIKNEQIGNNKIRGGGDVSDFEK